MVGQCNQCHKVWTLETRQGVCQWCGKVATCQATTQALRSVKSSRRRQQRQLPSNDKDYDQLDGDWLPICKVAKRFNHKAKGEDTQDLLHDIILTLAVARRNNGHKPFTEAMMYRIASRRVADYWRAYYKVNNGLDCHSCSKAQRHRCKEDWLYADCPKAIKLEYLEKPIIDSGGNLTELGELIADDKALDLDAWVSDSTWEIGYKPRLVAIAHKLKAGIPLDNGDRSYLKRFRKSDQIRLFE